eukprot:2483219-Amphidinium_carterae.1
MEVWEVVGGSDKGGIIVRAFAGLDSTQDENRLRTGALVEQLAIQGDRLQYRLLSGWGPKTGW